MTTFQRFAPPPRSISNAQQHRTGSAKKLKADVAKALGVSIKKLKRFTFTHTPLEVDGYNKVIQEGSMSVSDSVTGYQHGTGYYPGHPFGNEAYHQAVSNGIDGIADAVKGWLQQEGSKFN